MWRQRIGEAARRWARSVRDRNRGLVGWFNLIFVPLLVVLGGILVWLGVEERRAQGSGGVAGTATILDCHRDPSRRGTWGPSSTWLCDGEFTADDGSVHIARVKLLPAFSQRPSGPVAVRVSGPDAYIAAVPSGWDWLVPFAAGVVLVLFGLIHVISGRLFEPPDPKRGRSKAARRSRR